MSGLEFSSMVDVTGPRLGPVPTSLIQKVIRVTRERKCTLGLAWASCTSLSPPSDFQELKSSSGHLWITQGERVILEFPYYLTQQYPPAQRLFQSSEHRYCHIFPFKRTNLQVRQASGGRAYRSVGGLRGIVKLQRFNVDPHMAGVGFIYSQIRGPSIEYTGYLIPISGPALDFVLAERIGAETD
jgi:hypothetical protein